MPAKNSKDFEAVQARLRNIMKRYERGGLKASADQPGNYVLAGPPNEASQGKEVWFGAVQTRKNYVAYHLMAVYAFPDLLKSISPELKKCMQGKSCFNFKAVDDQLFKELAGLTDQGYRRYKQAGLVK